MKSCLFPRKDHTLSNTSSQLFILFFYLFTNLHDLSLSTLHLITYNLHPYHIYKYTLLTIYFPYIHFSQNFKRICTYLHSLLLFLILSSSLFSLPYTLKPFISSLNPTPNRLTLFLLLIFLFFYSYSLIVYISNFKQVRFLKWVRQEH